MPKIYDNIETHFAQGLGEHLASATRKETSDLFDKLSTCYLNNRYPVFKNKMSAQIKEPYAKVLCSQTQEVFAWLLVLKP